MNWRSCWRESAVGGSPPRTASRKLRTIPVPIEEMGFARVDLHRRLRCGFPEVIFGQGKTAEQIEAILRTLLRHEQGGLVTRVEPAVAAHLNGAFPEGEHNVLRPGPSGSSGRSRSGTEARQGGHRDGGDQRPGRRRGGTGDGRGVELRRHARGRRRRGRAPSPLAGQLLQMLGEADAMVVVAGMEGALPSVVGGLVELPGDRGPHEHRLRRQLPRPRRTAGDAQQLRVERRRGEHRRRLQRRARRRPDRTSSGPGPNGRGRSETASAPEGKSHDT